jgi:hypothetical protein
VRLADDARVQSAARQLWNASQDRTQQGCSSLASLLLRWCTVGKGWAANVVAARRLARLLDRDSRGLWI